MDPEPAWTRDLPGMQQWLEQLDERACARYEDDPGALVAALEEWLPGLVDRERLIAVPDWRSDAEASLAFTLPETRATDMPGRKRLQSGAFAAALAPLQVPVLDWCCGKGHLARTLAPHCPGPVTGLEWNAGLVADGNRLATRFGDAVTLRCEDVMVADPGWPDRVHGVALHACGDLHRKLMRDAVARTQPRVSFSPCCYHLTGALPYRPLSSLVSGDPGRLELESNDLRLAVQETVTAPARVRAQTALVSQWRLAFDGLQRQVRRVNEYLPLPSHPKHLVNEGFAAFCRWAARQKGIELPGNVSLEEWLDHGARRLQEVRQQELVRHLFRRPMELWLVLDYAIYLEEAGYEVRLGTFCDRELTPRNLLLDATRGGN